MKKEATQRVILLHWHQYFDLNSFPFSAFILLIGRRQGVRLVKKLLFPKVPFGGLSSSPTWNNPGKASKTEIETSGHVVNLHACSVCDGCPAAQWTMVSTVDA